MKTSIHCSLMLSIVGLCIANPAVAQQTPVDDLTFEGEQLKACVNKYVEQPYAEDVETLFCRADTPVSNLDGIEQFTNLRTLFLESEGETIIESLVPLTRLSELTQLELSGYNNSDELFGILDPSNINLKHLSLEAMPNLTNAINQWVYQFSDLRSLTFSNLAVSDIPAPERLPALTGLEMGSMPAIDFDEVVAEWGTHGLLELELSGVSREETTLHTAGWRLSGIEHLLLSDVTLDSLASLASVIERDAIDLSSLRLEVDVDDWETFAEFSNIAPNLRVLSLDSTDFEDYTLLEGFSQLENIDLNQTQDSNAQALLNVIEQNANIYSIYIGHGSNFYCQDKQQIADEDTNGVIYFHSWGSACRTGQYSFNVTPPTENVSSIIAAADTVYPTDVGVELTGQPFELAISVAPIYDDNFAQHRITVQFDDGSNRSVYLRYDQPQSTPIALDELTLPDPELNACVKDMVNFRGNQDYITGEAPKFAHELIYLLCDEPEYAVSDLTGLEFFNGLEYIQMFGSGEKITDVRPILALPRLSWLTLTDKQLTDEVFNVLSDYKSFQRFWTNLNLSRNQLSNPRVFDNWFAMSPSNSLYFSGNQYRQVPYVALQSNFGGHVDISDNPIADIPATLAALDELSNVNILGLGNLSLNDYEQLIFPDTLLSLGLNNNGLTDLDSLVLPETLTYITLDGNPLSQIEPLYELERLNSVSLRGTEITQLPDIAVWPSLRRLTLDETPLQSLAALAELSRDTVLRLDVGLTPLTDYSPALDKPWLDLSSPGNAHVPCPVYEALEGSATEVFWTVCEGDDGTIVLASNNVSVALAEDSKRYGRINRTEYGFEFIPNPGQEGWITLTVVINDEDGNSYTLTLKVYIEPGSNPALDTGIPVVILVAGDDDKN